LAGLDENGRSSSVLGEPDISGGRLLLINDVVTTGQGLQALAATVRARGAEVAGAAWFATRTDIDAASLLAAPGFTVCDLALPAWRPEACPHCASNEFLQHAIDLN
jgi:orotate phosphoribosyltransferase